MFESWTYDSNLERYSNLGFGMWITIYDETGQQFIMTRCNPIVFYVTQGVQLIDFSMGISSAGLTDRFLIYSFH